MRRRCQTSNTHKTRPCEWRLNTQSKAMAMRLRQAMNMHLHSRRNAQGPCSDLPFRRISAYSETRFRTRLLLQASAIYYTCTSSISRSYQLQDACRLEGSRGTSGREHGRLHLLACRWRVGWYAGTVCPTSKRRDQMNRGRV